MYSLQSIQWMIGCMELCGGLHFRTILFPSSAFTLTFFSFCWDGGAKGRQGRKNTQVLVCTQTCTQPPVHTFPASCQDCLRRFTSCVDSVHTMQWMRSFIYKIPVWGTLGFKERRVQRRRQVVFCLAEVEWCDLWVICAPHPTPFLIVDNPTGAAEEYFTWNRCQGNCEGRRSPRREAVTQVDGYTEVLFTFAQGPMCVNVCVWVHADYHVIACNYILGGGIRGALGLSLHLLTNELSIKQGKGKVYTQAPLRFHSFVNRSVIADKTDNKNTARF